MTTLWRQNIIVEMIFLLLKTTKDPISLISLGQIFQYNIY